jgi:hypothetical protein
MISFDPSYAAASWLARRAPARLAAMQEPRAAGKPGQGESLVARESGADNAKAIRTTQVWLQEV